MEQTRKPAADYRGLSFFDYMRKRYEGKDSPRGDLVEELMRLYDHEILVERITQYVDLLDYRRLIRDPRALKAITPALWIEYREATGTAA